MVERDRIEEDSMTAVLPLVDPHLLERHDLTVDDLADLPEDLRYELIDGRLVLTPHARPSHQMISKNVGFAIDQRCPEEFVLNIEQAILIAPHIELVPDAVILSEAAPDTSPVPADDVLLVVEVISKSSQSTDRKYKLDRYANAGIPFYWIIDPLADRVTFTQFSLHVDGFYTEVLQTDRRVTVQEPWEITLDLPAWTRKRDRMRTAGTGAAPVG
jgi:Uma2 family endonuclease